MNTQSHGDVKELLHHVDELVDNAHRLETENNQMKNDIDILSKENDNAHSIIEQLEDTRIKYEELLNEQASQESILSIQKEISSSLNEKLASLNEEKSKIETDRSLEESLNAKVAENILLENKLLAATAEIEHVRLEQSNLISTYKNEIESVKIEKKNLDSLFISLSNAQQDIDNLKVKNALLSQEIAVANEERIKDKVTIDRLTLEQNRNMLDFAATISALAAIAT
jgi:chromosome segregation ATPase